MAPHRDRRAPSIRTVMKILSVAYPFAPVGKDAVGGAEQVLSMLDDSLVAGGHRSIVIACEESAGAGTLICIDRVPAEINDSVRQKFQERCRKEIEQVLASEVIDVVHFHGLDFYGYLPKTDVPLLATIHLPPSWYPPHVWDIPSTTANVFFNFVSETQKRSCGLPYDIPVIENGVPPEDAVPVHSRRDFAMSLGRICPEKNFEAAIVAARRAGLPFILAGSVFSYEAHRRYFSDKIAPLLGNGCRFIGPACAIEKQKLLAAARCLLIPSLAPETSSLVAMEALSCGTPVVAYPSGELTNIVEHGVTGFLVHQEIEMADAISRCSSLEPELCRRKAHERFSAQRMVKQYFNLYDRLVKCASKKSPDLTIS